MTSPTDRARARTLTWAIVVAVCLGWAAGCQDDNMVDPPSTNRTGNVVVTLITTGSNQDPDGYHVVVDHGTPIAVSPSDELKLALPNGTHTIELVDLAANCLVSGANPRLVTVAAGGTAAVTFQVSCPLPGALKISTTTSGTSPDLDGYTLTIGGAFQGTIGPQEIREIGPLHPAIYNPRISSVAGNCTVAGGANRFVNVAEGVTENVLFAVSCVPRIDDTPGERLVVAMRSTGDDDSNLYFMELDGQGTQRLTDNVGDEYTPEISADGDRVLFVQFGPGGRSLRVIDRVTRQETVLPTAGADRAVWSPDGSRIAFIRSGRLFRMNSDGTGEIPLTSGSGDQDPYWSPDGSRIVFTRGTRAFLVNADGSGLRQLSDLASTSGPWAPDGNSILLTRLLQTCTSNYYYYCYYYAPAWTPSDLVIHDVQSGQQTLLTQTPGVPEWSPVWAANGQRIFFLSAVAGNPDVFAIQVGSTAAVNLSHSPAAETWITIGQIGGAASVARRR
jgi:Tol biopolymer transport system component